MPARGRRCARQSNGAGYGVLLLDAAATRFGAVETPAEGQCYARFLAEHRGEYDGVILCLPNFGDETGAVAALQDAGVPILIQAYPDELDQMALPPAPGRLLRQIFHHGCLLPIRRAVHHASARIPSIPPERVFARQLHEFAATCRVVRRLRRLTVGAIGARTTAFKTIRFDELALQRYGVTTETFDLSEVFRRVRAIDAASEAFVAKTAQLAGVYALARRAGGVHPATGETSAGAGRDDRRVWVGRPRAALLAGN